MAGNDDQGPKTSSEGRLAVVGIGGTMALLSGLFIYAGLHPQYAGKRDDCMIGVRTVYEAINPDSESSHQLISEECPSKKTEFRVYREGECDRVRVYDLEGKLIYEARHTISAEHQQRCRDISDWLKANQ